MLSRRRAIDPSDRPGDARCWRRAASSSATRTARRPWPAWTWRWPRARRWRWWARAARARRPCCGPSTAWWSRPPARCGCGGDRWPARTRWRCAAASATCSRKGASSPTGRWRRNVALVPALLGEDGGWPAERRRERVREVLELVGLPAERYGARHPRGAVRRPAAAGGLRPGAGGGPGGGAPGRALRRPRRPDPGRAAGGVAGLLERLGKTLLLVTHDLGEAFAAGGPGGGDADGRDPAGGDAGGAGARAGKRVRRGASLRVGRDR